MSDNHHDRTTTNHSNALPALRQGRRLIIGCQALAFVLALGTHVTARADTVTEALILLQHPPELNWQASVEMPRFDDQGGLRRLLDVELRAVVETEADWRFRLEPGINEPVEFEFVTWHRGSIRGPNAGGGSGHGGSRGPYFLEPGKELILSGDRSLWLSAFPWDICDYVGQGTVRLDFETTFQYWLRYGIIVETDIREVMATITVFYTYETAPFFETICPDDPRDFRRRLGGAVSGDARALCEADQQWLKVAQSSSVSPLMPHIRMEYWAHASFPDGCCGAALDFAVESHVTAMVAGQQSPDTLRTYVYNLESRSFELFDQRGTNPHDDELIEFVIDTNACDYMATYSGRVRIRQDVFNPGQVFSPNWSLKVDLYEVTVTY